MASSKNKKEDVHLIVVVNGKAVHLKADQDDALASLIEPALDKANVADKSDLERWIFKNAAGDVLDKTQAIGSFGFKHNEEVFLSLEAGVVG